MPRKLPASIRAPITDLATAKAWIEALHAADLMFHFEDSPDSIVQADGEPLFFERDFQLIRDRVDALYALEWGPRPGMGYYYCPIGYSLSLDSLEPERQATDYPPGFEEITRDGELVLLDCCHTTDYKYGAPGRYTVYDEGTPGGHLADYDTPDEAYAAHPALADRFACDGVLIHVARTLNNGKKFSETRGFPGQGIYLVWVLEPQRPSAMPNRYLLFDPNGAFVDSFADPLSAERHAAALLTTSSPQPVLPAPSRL